jgi:hypothetical protein
MENEYTLHFHLSVWQGIDAFVWGFRNYMDLYTEKKIAIMKMDFENS